MVPRTGIGSSTHLTAGTSSSSSPAAGNTSAASSTAAGGGDVAAEITQLASSSSSGISGPAQPTPTGESRKRTRSGDTSSSSHHQGGSDDVSASFSGASAESAPTKREKDRRTDDHTTSSSSTEAYPGGTGLSQASSSSFHPVSSVETSAGRLLTAAESSTGDILSPALPLVSSAPASSAAAVVATAVSHFVPPPATYTTSETIGLSHPVPEVVRDIEQAVLATYPTGADIREDELANKLTDALFAAIKQGKLLLNVDAARQQERGATKGYCSVRPEHADARRTYLLARARALSFCHIADYLEEKENTIAHKNSLPAECQAQYTLLIQRINEKNQALQALVASRGPASLGTTNDNPTAAMIAAESYALHAAVYHLGQTPLTADDHASVLVRVEGRDNARPDRLIQQQRYSRDLPGLRYLPISDDLPYYLLAADADALNACYYARDLAGKASDEAIRKYAAMHTAAEKAATAHASTTHNFSAISHAARAAARAQIDDPGVDAIADLYARHAYSGSAFNKPLFDTSSSSPSLSSTYSAASPAVATSSTV